MSEFVLFASSLVLVWGAWRFLGSNYFGRGRDRTDLPDQVLFLTQSLQNTGRLRAVLPQEKVEFIVERTAGDDDSAVVELILPSAGSQALLSEVQSGLKARGASVRIVDGGALKAAWSIQDIWREDSVAPVVSGIWLALETMGASQSAKINFSHHGPRSDRRVKKLLDER